MSTPKSAESMLFRPAEQAGCPASDKPLLTYLLINVENTSRHGKDEGEDHIHIARSADGKSIECGISEPLYEDYIGIALEVFAYRHGIPVLYGRKDAEDVKVELIPSSSIGLGLTLEKEEGGISASIIDYPGTTIKWFVNGIEIEGNGSFIVISYDDEALKDNTEDALNTLLATVSTENNVIFSATGYFPSRDGGICK